jgi:threonine dehydrogenase-like Zn-dependent dehydrogenase
MGVGQGDNVWVAGQGPIGHFTAQAAKAAGARVTVTDMLQKRLDVARRCGAHVVLSAADENTEQRLKEGGPYNYIFDCCSAKELLFDIHKSRMLNRSGAIAMMAVRDTVSYPWSLLHGTEARIETSCHFDRDDLRVLLFLYEQKLVRIEPMVSHFVSIDEAPRIYDMLADNNTEVFGVIFDWTANI